MLVRSLARSSERITVERSGRARVRMAGQPVQLAARHAARGAGLVVFPVEIEVWERRGARVEAGSSRLAERSRVIQEVLDACLGRFLEIELIAASVANVEWPHDLGQKIEGWVGIPRRAT